MALFMDFNFFLFEGDIYKTRFLDAIASLGLGVTLRMLKTKRLETYQTS